MDFIEQIHLPPANTYPEEIGEAIIKCFDAAEEYYANYKGGKKVITETVDLIDGSRLTFVPPEDKHFIDSEDCHAMEWYQSYSYMAREDAEEASAIFFLTIAPELDCDLGEENVRQSWERCYGTAETFAMEQTELGIYKCRAEMRNKAYHKVSYFLQTEENHLLECGMMVYKPGRRKKLDEDLGLKLKEFAASCKF